MEGMLYVVATPIGNLEDVTHRALRVIGEADVLACEDTRRTRLLLDRYNIPAPRVLISYHEHNEERAGAGILAHLESGRTVALVSDSGMPGVSDPGYRIVNAARERGLPIEVIPGASAVSTALVASGLPSSSYTFKGFPPPKQSARRRWLRADGDLPHTLVIFESPRRLAKLLGDSLEVLGDRLAAVCIELTKKFESVHRGYLSDLAKEFSREETVRGEVTVVIAGSNPKFVRPVGREGEAG
jgi:16S rRNA (cytidine1402-2'-O)-methyltransferase